MFTSKQFLQDILFLVEWKLFEVKVTVVIPGVEINYADHWCGEEIEGPCQDLQMISFTIAAPHLLQLHHTAWVIVAVAENVK